MSKDYISVAFNSDELQAIRAALRDKISNLKANHLFVKQYLQMLESIDCRIKLAANTVFGVSSKSNVSSEAIEKEHN